MKHLHRKPYFYFWLTSLFIIIIGYISYIEIGGSALDINIHDTYFVIAHYHFYILFASLFAFIGIVYWIFKKINVNLKKLLINVHTLVSNGCIPVYFLGLLYFNKTEPYPNFPLFDNPNKDIFTTVVVSVFILVQIIFLINLIISTINHLVRKS